jgi:hypothetical protein
MFSINDNGLLGNDFALSWAMSCANDVIQGIVNIPSSYSGFSGSQTPLPAALPLFAGGLGLLGYLGRRRQRRQDTAASRPRMAEMV